MTWRNYQNLLPMEGLNKAISALKKGGVVICPTDTVYGFLADASNKKAVEKIYKIKKRLKSKPLPIFVKDLTMAKGLAEISKEQEKIIKKYWPGKYTFVLKCKSQNPNLKVKVKNRKLYGVAKDTIAIRIPKHKFLNELLKKINRPLVQTSVNISGREVLRTIEDIKKSFREQKEVLIIDGGNLKKSKPSAIMGLTSPKLIKLR